MIQPNAYKTALNLLARREHSRHELQNKLLQKNFPQELIATVLDKLATEGLLNDQRFCEAFIHSRTNKGYGPLRIKEELRQRGIPAEIISAYLDNDWLSRIDTIRRKRFGTEMPKDPRERARQIRFLQYRGFTLEQINKALKDENINGNTL